MRWKGDFASCVSCLSPLRRQAMSCRFVSRMTMVVVAVSMPLERCREVLPFGGVHTSDGVWVSLIHSAVLQRWAILVSFTKETSNVYER
jgi:hypothetical protein